MILPVSLGSSVRVSPTNDVTEELAKRKIELQASRDKLSQLELSSNQLNQKFETFEFHQRRATVVFLLLLHQEGMDRC
jgi:prefoldin subunit 5